MLTIQAVDHIVLNVADVEVSAAWYEQVLGMARVDQRTASGDIRTSMMFGASKINLRPVDVLPENWITARSPAVGSEDLCFLTTAEPNAVAQHFGVHGIEVVTGPVTKSGARGPIQSVYVRDPDGNLIEVSSYR
jgi:catechol 2,3-dioxygenase-like lactoylglutathione lyase family enzyme